MPQFEVKAPDGKVFDVNAPDGATEKDAIAYVQKQYYGTQSVDMPKAVGPKIESEIGRQFGLTARAGIEGVGNTLDTLASPIRGALNLVSPKKFLPGSLGILADTLNLPKPITPEEKIANSAAGMMAGGAGFASGAGAISKMAIGVPKAVLSQMGANLGSQVASAGGAGLSGGYAKESGMGPVGQFAASLAGGIAAPMALNTARSVGNTVGNYAQSVLSPQSINIKIDNVIKQSGLNMSDLPTGVINSIRDDISKALKTGGDISPDAIRRLADYKAVGAVPTRAGLTLNPVDITQQKNLAKIGANLSDPNAQILANVANKNRMALIGKVNELGAENAPDAIAAGQKVISALQSKASGAKANIDALYSLARASDGRPASLDPSAFTNTASDLLEKNLKQAFLPDSIKSMVNDFASGKVPLTVDSAEQFKTILATAQRGTMDGNVKQALGLVRQALEETPLLPGRQINPGNLPAVAGTVPPGAQQLGKEAIDNFNKARDANRAWMNTVEKIPALKAVIDGAEPDKFVKTYIIGNGTNSNTMDVARLKNFLSDSPKTLNAVKQNIADYLKSKALNGAADEVGNFSQSAYNKALKEIGERKLSMFFDKEELAQLKAVGRVASYEQFQPTGSAVNNSNTASGIAGILDRVGNLPILRKIPFGDTLVADPAKNISIGIQAGRSTNIPKSLLSVPQEQQPLGISPLMLMGPGLLSP